MMLAGPNQYGNGQAGQLSSHGPFETFGIVAWCHQLHVGTSISIWMPSKSFSDGISVKISKTNWLFF